ncbi:hypothetical protein D3C84_737560 [compost metagenome]
MALAEGLATGNQRGIVFQAGQLLTGLQQASTQVSFARAPVQPVPGGIGKLQSAGKSFDLLPLAPRYIHIQSMGWRFQRMGRHFVQRTQRQGHGRQRSKWLRRIHKGRVVVSAFRLFQRPPA